eukprot:TRINITY_DN14402_c0_g2_i6.p1 TRINITY_DN14402_c0_g2~~TRINITY_DN14402_c0_g2_i6.p1  ORF type:complete len:390 (-),score=11.11 TRINITY_DN14402_c0_g2_i6:666-1835(-)
MPITRSKEQILSKLQGNFDLQQQLIRKAISIPIVWQQEIHTQLVELCALGVHFQVQFEPYSLDDIYQFSALVTMSINLSVQLIVQFNVEDLISSKQDVNFAQECIFSMKHKITCLELYSIEKIFDQTFFQRFLFHSKRYLRRLVLHYSFDPKWHKLFQFEKDQIIRDLAKIDTVVQYCSPDEKNVRVMGQLPITEFVIQNAGIGKQDDVYLFLIELEKQILYPQDIQSLEIAHFPVGYFDQMAINVLSTVLQKMKNLESFYISNYDVVFSDVIQSLQFHKLRSLVLNNLRSVKDFSYLEGLDGIRYLSLAWVAAGRQSSEIQGTYTVLQLNFFPNLKKLTIKNCLSIQVEGLRELHCLDMVCLYNCSVVVRTNFQQQLRNDVVIQVYNA